jgi:N-acetylmuramoyl-L-alanine amidase
LYKEMLSREAPLRTRLEAQNGGATLDLELLRSIRILAGAYDDMARLFPVSGYSDNALWQGGMLLADAFRTYGEARDRTTALRMLRAVPARFPTSSLNKQIPAQVTRLEEAAVLGTLRAIRREVHPDVLRVMLELDREVPFHDERLDGPPRVFVDLQNTHAVEGLRDAVLAFPADAVKQIRVGVHPDARTRVVLDLNAPAAYSVYVLYNPYRVVIDFERPGTRPGAAPGASGPAPASTSVPAVSPARPAANRGGGFSLSRQLGLGIARVVIDPGHGGHDPGAKARGLTESDLVLDVALRLETLLKARHVEVVLTRRADQYVPLEERTAIANRSGADLFLSIHANASANATAHGVETYFLNFAPNAEAEAIAARENAGSSGSMRDLPDLVETIALNNKIDESRDFAAIVQTALSDRLRKANTALRDLGVKQAPFVVLIGATMPSVLSEISFMTNSQEAALLETATYRQQIAEALLDGVMGYQASVTGTR